MVRTKRITLVVLTTILLQVNFVAGHIDQTKKMIEIPGLSSLPDADEKATTTIRLRGAGKGINNEERGILRDTFVRIPSVKLGLILSLIQKEAPAKILQEFEYFGIPLENKYLFLWLRYVLKYRKKV
ncbi:RxLR effector protein, partial [Phytophthora megakarya]